MISMGIHLLIIGITWFMSSLHYSVSRWGPNPNRLHYEDRDMLRIASPLLGKGRV